MPGRAFLAFPGMRGMLEDELSRRFGYGKIVRSATVSGNSFVREGARWFGDLLYCPNFDGAVGDGFSRGAPYFSRCSMTEPFSLEFGSIGEAARALREIQRNWAPYQFQFFRRANLIQEKLPYMNLKPRKFPLSIPDSPMGLYTLTGENSMIASASTTSPLPAGKIEFVEDHENPPSRAYLKIQEALSLFGNFFGEFPKAGEKCFEAGACPGGWTYVLMSLGCDVLAVDRAPLADFLMEDPHVRFLAHDAFTLAPGEVARRLSSERIDWLLSDVICYPERLLEWLNLWIGSGLFRNAICTIKMQGEIDWNLISEFGKIENSRIVHLNYNKHELTVLVHRD